MLAGRVLLQLVRFSAKKKADLAPSGLVTLSGVTIRFHPCLSEIRSWPLRRFRRDKVSASVVTHRTDIMVPSAKRVLVNLETGMRDHADLLRDHL